MSDGIFIGAASGARQCLDLRRANRHGLIAGATGTGKTVTLQGIVEGLSAAGVPCFVADVKGDLAGLAMAGSPTSKTHAAFAERAAAIGQTDWVYRDNPVQFWDLFGEAGHPIRATVSEMGPLLLARMLGLTDVQEGVLNIAFHVADTEGLLLLDLDDLGAMLSECAARGPEVTTTYGNVSKASVGAIQRALLQLRTQGGENFFGEPALDIHDLIACQKNDGDDQGRGVVNILAADKLMSSPKLYASFLLWLLSELFETLPEIGDPDQPVLCFFFDEAHLLFDDANPALLNKIEQVVRLIRSKGVGVYFITQNPMDIPDTVAGQLGNRIQHALRAFTPRDQAAVRAAATTFRPNPALDVASVIGELRVGEALVSLLQADGSPCPVERALIKPPASRVGPLTSKERGVMIATDAIGDRYDAAVNRESAYERLQAKADAARPVVEEDRPPARDRVSRPTRAPREEPTMLDRVIESATRSASSSIGRQIANEVGRQIFGGGRRRSSTAATGQLVRGILGGLFR